MTRKGAQCWTYETVPSIAFAAVGQSWEVYIYRTQRGHGTEGGSTPNLSMVKWLRSDLRVGCWEQMGRNARWPWPSLPSSTVYKEKMSSIFLHTNNKGNVFLLSILQCTERRSSELQSRRASGLYCHPGTGLERFLFIVLISLSVLSERHLHSVSP